MLSEAAKILDIMREYHRLPHEQYHDWKLYARLHRLMVSEKLIPVEMTIMQLKETPKDKMIGYFFMGDLLRHELIFRDVSIYF